MADFSPLKALVSDEHKGHAMQLLLQRCFEVAVAAAQTDAAIRRLWGTVLLPWMNEHTPMRKHVWVVGAGKASAAMAHAVEDAAGAAEQIRGLVLTRKRHGVSTRFVEVVEAAHPVPDEEGQRAARRLVKCLEDIPTSDPVIALISGGGSSLLSVPVKDIPFVDLQQLNRALLACGAPIDEINMVRKHVTQTLGGQLAQVCQSVVAQLLVSDVAGDDPSHIVSGPFSPDESTFADAHAVLKRWAVQVPHSVARYIDRGRKGEIADTPNASSVIFRKVQTHLLASNAMSLEAVRSYLCGQGYTVLSLGDALDGEARHVARVQAAMVQQIAQAASGWPKVPVALLSGGECSVTLADVQMKQAKGGRNSEFLLALVQALGQYAQRQKTNVPIAVMAADTDGMDGTGGHAGALWLPGDAEQAAQLGLSAQWHLDQHTSHDFFERMGRLLVTGPTKTNVNDLRVILIGNAVG